jgi:hypothetical protein
MNVSFAILILFWSMENVWNALRIKKPKNTKIIYVTESKKLAILKIFINQDILLKIMNVSSAILILFWSMENVWNALRIKKPLKIKIIYVT